MQAEQSPFTYTMAYPTQQYYQVGPPSTISHGYIPQPQMLHQSAPGSSNGASTSMQQSQAGTLLPAFGAQTAADHQMMQASMTPLQQQQGANGSTMQMQHQQQQQQQMGGGMMMQQGQVMPAGGSQPLRQNAPTVVYTTQYAGMHGQVPVFEAMIRGIAVMMRRSDMWVNATQILKVAGIAKTQRSKLLDKEIVTGVHEKVQGGYGRYQGTWVPYEIGVNLANQFYVGTLLAPIFQLRNNPAGAGVPPMPASGRQVSPSSRAAGKTGRAVRPMSSHSARSRPGSMDSPFTTTAIMNHIIDPNLQATQVGQHPMAPMPSPMRYDGNQYGLGGPNVGGGLSQHPTAHILQPQANSSNFAASASNSMPPPQLPLKRSFSDAIGNEAQILAPPSEIMNDTSPRSAMQALGGGPYVDQYGRAYAMDAGMTSQGGQLLTSMQNGQDLHPAKRMRSGSSVSHPTPSLMADVDMMNGQFPTEILPGLLDADAEGEDDAASETSAQSVLERHPIPEGMQLSTKPRRPRNPTSAAAAISSPNKTRSRLLSIFEKEQDANVDLNTLLSTPVKAGAIDAGGDTSSVMDDLDINHVIDDRGHTALHWATALARANVVEQLLQRGADMHRGNFAGETPLIRAVLTTNNAEANTFGFLLSTHLSPSLHTIDSSYRTVLHHIALVAGVKGRAASANSYMSTCLEYLQKTETEEKMRAFVNVQDIHGDTALCVAARVGNKTLVKLLLEAGADKAKANDLGFRPVDFGLDVPDLVLANGDAIRPAIKRMTSLAKQKGDEVSQRFVEIIKDLNAGFKSEMALKHAQVEQIRGDVISSTNQLAEDRKKLSAAQTRLTEYEEVQQRVANLERAAKDEESFNWNSGVEGISEIGLEGEFTDADPPVPPEGSTDTLVELRRIRQWQTLSEVVMQQRLQAMEGMSAEKAVQYRKVIAACTKVPADQLDEEKLDQLMVAVESDGPSLDMTKINTFLAKYTSSL